MKTDKKWFLLTLFCTISTLICFALTIIVIDPYFHYHKPLKNLSYRIHNERYQNNGIAKNFDYDALITGTSMTQNFKTSQAEQLWNFDFIKIPFSGAFFKEVDEQVRRALNSNSDLKMVIRGIDSGKILVDSDHSHYDSYPTYLYDDNLFNDLSYVLNKDVFFNDLLYGTIYWTITGNSTTTFDEYNNWMFRATFGKETIVSVYPYAEPAPEQLAFTEEDRIMVYDNITQNVIETAQLYPEIDFYLFLTPYSISYMNNLFANGSFNKFTESMQYASELMLQEPNIHLFSFWGNYSITTDLDNYEDPGHYGEWVNEMILTAMFEKENQLTLDNYEQHFAEIKTFYEQYDYKSALQ